MEYGEDAEPPTEGYQTEITVDGQKQLFIGWISNYMNVKQNEDVMPIFAPAVEVELKYAYGKDTLPSTEMYEVAADNTTALPAFEAPGDGYDAGWFQCFSGMPITDEITTSVKFSESSSPDDRMYIGTRYRTVDFNVMNDKEVVDHEVFPMFCMQNTLSGAAVPYEYYCYVPFGEDHYETVSLMVDDINIKGYPIGDWLFTVDGISEKLSYDQILDLIYTSSTPFAITAAEVQEMVMEPIG